ncbi:MAG: hypothetical protein A4E44_01175 [Methanosaeta sp. PtaB.Bin018]|nr:MAG: hypothetical protein A4E44_01175 [Methanosaeta sp. PtaB.Bin018]
MLDYGLRSLQIIHKEMIRWSREVVQPVDYGRKGDVLVGDSPVTDGYACELRLLQADGNDVSIKHIAATGHCLYAFVLVLDDCVVWLRLVKITLINNKLRAIFLQGVHDILFRNMIPSFVHLDHHHWTCLKIDISRQMRPSSGPLRGDFKKLSVYGTLRCLLRLLCVSGSDAISFSEIWISSGANSQLVVFIFVDRDRSCHD